MRIETCGRQALGDWVTLRRALWPDATEAEHRREAEALLARGGEAAAFIARDALGRAIGFAEATLRRDHVNGCSTSPVAFLEGILVRPEWRRQGVARRLCGAVEGWAMALGVSELASDADLRNRTSRRMHAALGFEETERVVFFRKELPARF
jgi:aminoglycoside 6'-N-acetyltransferase I